MKPLGNVKNTLQFTDVGNSYSSRKYMYVFTLFAKIYKFTVLIKLFFFLEYDWDMTTKCASVLLCKQLEPKAGYTK